MILTINNSLSVFFIAVYFAIGPRSGLAGGDLGYGCRLNRVFSRGKEVENRFPARRTIDETLIGARRPKIPTVISQIAHPEFGW